MAKKEVDPESSMIKDEKVGEKGRKGSDVCALIFTIIIMLNGLALTAIGGFLFSHPLVSYMGPSIGGDVWYSGENHHLQMAFIEFASIITILQGGLVIFFMTLACFAITSSNHTAHCYIGTYLVCLMISVVFTSVLFLKETPSQWDEALEESFTTELERSYQGPNGQNSFTKAFNELQTLGSCCGISGPDNFQGPYRLNFTAWTENVDTLPDPCEIGCLDEMKFRSQMYFGLLAGFASLCIILQIPAFLNALCLCSAT